MTQASKEGWTILAQIGIICRGVIFMILSILTILGVLQKQPSKTADSVGALNYLENSFYGLPVLILLGHGIIIYIIWRIHLFYRVDKNQSTWNIVRYKANHLGIAFVYLFFLMITFQLIFNISSSGNFNYQKLINRYVHEWWAEVIIALVGLGVFGKGIFQFYLAYNKLFLDLVKVNEFPNHLKKVFIIFGRIGYGVRGIIFCVLGFLIFRASYSFYSDPNKSVADAFHFISREFGETVLFGIAVGLFIFSLFVFLKAKYRLIKVKG